MSESQNTDISPVAPPPIPVQEYPEVLAELERMQTKKPSWRTTAWVLVGALVLFLAIGAAGWDWKFTLWIIPVLLFHEGGHWAAMRLFRYRNLRMFFIPLFGAAVTGQNWNVAGWKKALVSLAGPLPGIALGVVLGIAGLVLKRLLEIDFHPAILTHAAAVAISALVAVAAGWASSFRILGRKPLEILRDE